jgi:hypothetical protein
MIDLSLVTEFIYQYFENVKVSNGGTHFNAKCILCGDSKKSHLKRRFNLDWNGGNTGYHCFNCGEHGSFVKLYALLKGISERDAVKDIFRKEIKWNSGDLKNKLNGKCDTEELVESENFNYIKTECHDVSLVTDSIIEKSLINALKKFYSDRKISLDHKMYIAYKGHYKNRIVIPIYDEHDNIIYFQARRIPGTNKYPKYKNPSAPKELVIMNKHIFDPIKPIVVTEGIIDAWMVGNQGTTCLGKYIQEEFLESLFKLTDRVIIALDNDDEAKKALRDFIKENKYSRKCKYFLYPAELSKFKDINKIVVEHSLSDSIYNIILKNSCDYSTAYTKLFISMKLVEGKNEDNIYRIGLHMPRRI